MFKVIVCRSSVRSYKDMRLFLVLFSCVVAASCGKKTFPRPVHEKPLAQIQDLEAQVDPKGVKLSWSLPPGTREAADQNRYLLVLKRAELPWENRDCLDCPALFQEVQSFDPKFPQPAVITAGQYTWSDGNVTQKAAYRYQIDIRDQKGRLVSSSNAALARVLPTPSAPTKLAARIQGAGILLRWQKPAMSKKSAAAQDPLKFVVERQLAGKSQGWENISPVPIDGSEYLDNTVASEKTYDYRITPVLTFEGTSIYGEPGFAYAIKAPDTVTPPPPQSIWVIPAGGKLEVHWTASDGRAAGYHVYRRQGQEITRLTANPIAKPPYIDQSVQKNEIYFYAVSAVSPAPQMREGLVSQWVEIRNVQF